MGNGVAQVSAQAGLEVALRGIDDELLQGGFGSIIKSLDMMEQRGKISGGGVGKD